MSIAGAYRTLSMKSMLVVYGVVPMEGEGYVRTKRIIREGVLEKYQNRWSGMMKGRVE